ncbi:unnamed protein product [Amoebophrya sp. A25]|nr:unnamed protein product [Amoebophrya sp. A25]|eukprot:GSA25T00025896001.1
MASTDKDDAAPAADVEEYPNFELAQWKAKYLRDRDPQALEKIIAQVKKDRMVSFYVEFCAEANVTRDEKLVKEMEKEKDEKLTTFAATLKDAEENLGDVEVKNALLAKAEFLNKIGDMTAALEAYSKAFEKTVGIGGRMDNILSSLRIALFFSDVDKIKEYLAKGKEELKKGGDWERKNKLKVYEGVFKIMSRDFEAAAKLFLEGVATFTAVELVSFKDFVFYAVLSSMVGLQRADLKKKVIESPEILSVVHERAHVREFLFAYYECDYHKWTREFVHVIDHLKEDRYFQPHLMQICRQLRLNAFRQFITSYKSVTIKLMADTFGVTPDFVDREIYGFISQGRLNCKIDKVANVIETVDDAKNEKTLMYKDILNQGDDLLNKMQKLSAAIDR